MNLGFALRAAVATTLSAASVAAAESDLVADARLNAPEVVVIGDRANLLRIPGSGEIIEQQVLEDSRVFTVNEALRKVPGVYARDEEGFGLRPNIGIRGLNPTRSSKVLLLEDGLPLTYAPYGDNASYYHPPVDRFERIEVLKGSGQILFGPQTVGGVINYITPRPPEEFGGHFTLEGGNRDFGEARAAFGDTLGDTGYFVNVTRKQTDGVRDHMHFDVFDVSTKIVHDFSDAQSLTFRASHYDEDSDVPYSGLTLAEYSANPRANPFVNDEFTVDRFGSSLTHHMVVNEALAVTTSAYYTAFDRYWWRQSSNSGQRPNDASDPACGGLQNLSSTCGNEGRLREYWTAGIESRANLFHSLFGITNELDAGVRFHREDQSRLQINADTPNGRTPGVSVNGGIRENSDREVQAISAFIQNRFAFGDLSVTPGVRFEQIDYERRENLSGLRGADAVNQFIPGLGATYTIGATTTIFAGAHRGFAPPTVTDLINTQGGSNELDAELSWNYELGVRSALHRGATIEATAFRMDFENQVIPSSLASGSTCGATLCNAGETLHQGAELGLTLDSAGLIGTGYSLYMRTAYTWLADAEFRSDRISNVVPGLNVRGNRLPYAPENILSATLGFTSDHLRLQLEGVYTGAMFTDDANREAIAANGQTGLIPSYTIWNASANFDVLDTGWTLFVTGKNLFDKLYVADMSRGLIPGAPRLVQGGFTYRF